MEGGHARPVAPFKGGAAPPLPSPPLPAPPLPSLPSCRSHPSGRGCPLRSAPRPRRGSAGSGTGGSAGGTGMS